MTKTNKVVRDFVSLIPTKLPMGGSREVMAFPDPTWKITSTLGFHKDAGMDPLHPIHRSNGIPSVKYKNKKNVRAFVSSTSPLQPMRRSMRRGW